MPPATAPPEGTAPPPTAPPAPASAADAGKVTGSASVRFLPPVVNTSSGSAMTVALVIENANEVMASPLTIQWDPKILKMNDIGRGDFFSSDGQIPVFTKNIQNDTGTATINLNRLPGSSGVSGSGVLITMILQAVAPGSSPVRVPNLNVRDAKGATVAAGMPQMTITVK
jgi:general secretion pathway protein D